MVFGLRVARFSVVPIQVRGSPTVGFGSFNLIRVSGTVSNSVPGKSLERKKNIYSNPYEKLYNFIETTKYIISPA